MFDFVVQAGTDASFGHLTQAHLGLWADHVGERRRDLDTPKKEP